MGEWNSASGSTALTKLEDMPGKFTHGSSFEGRQVMGSDGINFKTPEFIFEDEQDS